MPKLKLAFLASHGGSNMQAIVDSCRSGKLNAEPCIVISNNSKAYALERARIEGIPAFHVSSFLYDNELDLSNKMIELFDEYGADTLILAGYMKKIPNLLIEHFKGRVLNIHPALLPKHGGEGMYGIKVHEDVIKSGEKVSGASIHLVDNNYDRGKVLGQMEVPVLANDSPETLAERVLKVEHKLYTDVLIRISRGEIAFA